MMAAPSWGSALIPEIVFCFYELMFCACAVMIVVGGAFERGRIIPSIIFGFCWATVAYCPISYWTWNANGWLFTFGALDFGMYLTLSQSLTNRLQLVVGPFTCRPVLLDLPMPWYWANVRGQTRNMSPNPTT